MGSLVPTDFIQPQPTKLPTLTLSQRFGICVDFWRKFQHFSVNFGLNSASNLSFLI